MLFHPIHVLLKRYVYNSIQNSVSTMWLVQFQNNFQLHHLATSTSPEVSVRFVRIWSGVFFTELVLPYTKLISYSSLTVCDVIAKRWILRNKNILMNEGLIHFILPRVWNWCLEAIFTNTYWARRPVRDITSIICAGSTCFVGAP